MLKILISTIAILSITIFFPNNVYAYIDPGTGSLILQVIIASIAAFIAFSKNTLNYIKKKLRNFYKKK